MSAQSLTLSSALPERSSVAIFWDVNTCPSKPAQPVFAVVSKLRNQALRLGSIRSFKVYCVGSSGAIVSSLQALGLVVIQCEDSGSESMMVDMMSFALDNPAPAAIVLISGNNAFTRCLSALRMRNYTVSLIVPDRTDVIFLSLANSVADWSDFGGDTRPDPSEIANASASPGVIEPSERFYTSSPTAARTHPIPPSPLALSFRATANTEPSIPAAQAPFSRSSTTSLLRETSNRTDHFAILVNVMQGYQRLGEHRPLLSKLGIELRNRDPHLYSRAGASTLGHYVQLAQEAGIVSVHHPGPGREYAELRQSH